MKWWMKWRMKWRRKFGSFRWEAVVEISSSGQRTKGLTDPCEASNPPELDWVTPVADAFANRASTAKNRGPECVDQESQRRWWRRAAQRVDDFFVAIPRGMDQRRSTFSVDGIHVGPMGFYQRAYSGHVARDGREHQR